MTAPRIALAETPEEIRRCYPVMKELRPHFQDVEKFIDQVRRQQAEGYQLVFLEDKNDVRAVAGYRILESLFSGKFVYVDDLVTLPADRSRGFGGMLLDWLIAQAQEKGCAHLELDSGVQRFDAHRFYFLKRMSISSYHFRIGTAAKD
jgi:GNAT superfamily N-acetyltransferase